jgi:probable rRNA maturation factor
LALLFVLESYGPVTELQRADGQVDGRGTHLVILHKKVPGLSGISLERFVLRARRATGLREVVNVLVTNSTAVRSFNRRFRGQNKATDVLSFPAASSVNNKKGDKKDGKKGAAAGDIAISADIALQNALRFGHSPAQEVKILTLHGILHLAGFDHERDNGKMAREEAKLRRALGLPTALIERTARGSKKSSIAQRTGARQSSTRSRA